MIRILKVTGESLSPTIEEGDFVLVGTNSFFFPLKMGDFVVFNHPQYGRMIKQVTGIQPDDNTLTVTGTHPRSVDSRQLGPIPMTRVTGKVLYHFSPS